MYASLKFATMIVLSTFGVGPALGAASLAPQGNIAPPAAFGQFCAKFAAQCVSRNGNQGRIVMTSDRWQQLKRINAEINRSVRARTDASIYGRADVWVLPEEGGAGDCEDFALLKRAKLIEAGWPSSVLLMTVVRDRQGEGHAVLTVVTNQGDLILDNRTGSILSWNDTGYRFFTRQSQHNPRRWVAIGDWQRKNRGATAANGNRRAAL